MGSLHLGGPTIQEVDGKMMMGQNIWGCCNQWVVILPILRYVSSIVLKLNFMDDSLTVNGTKVPTVICLIFDQ